MTGPRRGWARIAADDADQLPRLATFRAVHPEVLIGDLGFGVRQARIPEVNGETVITRYTIHELLDRLAVLFPDLPGAARCPPPPGYRALSGRARPAGEASGDSSPRNRSPRERPGRLARPGCSAPGPIQRSPKSVRC